METGARREKTDGPAVRKREEEIELQTNLFTSTFLPECRLYI